MTELPSPERRAVSPLRVTVVALGLIATGAVVGAWSDGSYRGAS